MIKGVFIQDLDLNIDDRGSLFEMCRIDWAKVDCILNPDQLDNEYQNQMIKQVYIVQNEKESVRAYHKHEKLVDLFCITNGYAKFILVDDRKNSATYREVQIINVNARKPQLIGVPAGVFHGWKGSDNSTLVSIANELYCGVERNSKIDEVRIPWDIYGAKIWETQFK